MSNASNCIPLIPEHAFSSGADLWIITSEQTKWWQEIDFKSGFLLSSSLLNSERTSTDQVEHILKQTEIGDFHFKSATKNLLLGTEAHFFNKWIYIISDDLLLTFSELEKISLNLKTSTIRFLGFPKETITQLAASLSTSLLQISYVE